MRKISCRHTYREKNLLEGNRKKMTERWVDKWRQKSWIQHKNEHSFCLMYHRHIYIMHYLQYADNLSPWRKLVKSVLYKFLFNCKIQITDYFLNLSIWPISYHIDTLFTDKQKQPRECKDLRFLPWYFFFYFKTYFTR